ncbi:metallothionein/ family 14 [Synechococcus sp. BIOS-U3-1]|nr:metallothionein [Synechococcus sp. BIOS-U3-1]QNI59812.1 metallothionein/ family 14 [Synechococcus sp. BIOS-U3-1]
MNTDLIKCQCNADCQCSVEVSKAVMRDGKAFCCEPCADGLICGCR